MFCQIVENKATAHFVYQDEKFVVFPIYETANSSRMLVVLQVLAAYLNGLNGENASHVFVE